MPGMTRLPQTASCFACGKAHPSGLRLEMRTDGERIRCFWTPRRDQIGFQHAIHGGLIATALDETMAWACGVLAGRFAYSVEIHIRYRKVLVAESRVECVGALTSPKSARLLATKAEILSDSGELMASATGKYVPIKGFAAEHVRAEFGGGADEILRYLDLEE